MKWIDRLERSLGHLAIPNLIRIIAIFNALVFVLYKLNPGFLGMLTLDPAAVLRGEVWRAMNPGADGTETAAAMITLHASPAARIGTDKSIAKTPIM